MFDYNEYTYNNIEDNLCFGQIGSSGFDENVFGGQADLGVIAVDDGRHGQDHVVRIVDDRVHWTVLDDRQVSFQVTVGLKNTENPMCFYGFI
jgi:hypothetical protein